MAYHRCMPRPTQHPSVLAGPTGRQGVMLRQGSRSGSHGKKRPDRYNAQRKAIKEASQ